MKTLRGINLGSVSFTQHIEFLEKALQALEAKDYKAFQVYFSNHIAIKYPTQKKLDEEVDSDSYKAFKDEIKKWNAQIADNLFDWDIFQEDQQTMQPLKQTFIDLCLETQKQYAKLKHEQEFLDFSDMAHIAYELLKDDMIHAEVTNQYDILLVDEFQDTDDLQESIIESISRGNNVFRVGDLKQSIYGFRMARPDIMKRHMTSTNPNDQTLLMNQNYRSDANIIDFNNSFYEKLMNNGYTERQFDDHDIAYVGTKGQKKENPIPIRFLYTGIWEKMIPCRHVQPKVSTNKIDTMSLPMTCWRNIKRAHVGKICVF